MRSAATNCTIEDNACSNRAANWPWLSQSYPKGEPGTFCYNGWTFKANHAQALVCGSVELIYY